jgi:hypothetical protein
VNTIEEVPGMKAMWVRMWRRKWLLAAATLAVFLTVGAVAWATGAGGTQVADPGSGAQSVAGGAVVALAAAGQETPAAAAAVGPRAGGAVKEKLAERIARREALMKLVRDKMSPEDQAAFDRLVQTAKDQRTALQQARKALNGTLKELRDLTKKYLEVDGSAAAVQ